MFHCSLCYLLYVSYPELWSLQSLGELTPQHCNCSECKQQHWPRHAQHSHLCLHIIPHSLYGSVSPPLVSWQGVHKGVAEFLNSLRVEVCLSPAWMVSKYLRHGHYCSGQYQDQQSEEDEEILKREISLVGLITRARKMWNKKKHFMSFSTFTPSDRETYRANHAFAFFKCSTTAKETYQDWSNGHDQNKNSSALVNMNSVVGLWNRNREFHVIISHHIHSLRSLYLL